MLRSMTGYGRGEAENSRSRIYIEIKSLNHKYFDIINRLPLGFLVFEDRIKKEVQKRIGRGRINFSLDYEDLAKTGTAARIDIKAAKRYAKLLRQLKNSLNLSGDISLQEIISIPGVMAHDAGRRNTEHLWPLIKKALTDAIKQLLASKEREGRMLQIHLFGIGKKIGRSLNAIIRYWEQQKKTQKDKLATNIKNITRQNSVYDQKRLEEEAAIFIRNSDISEELCRVDAHVKALKRAITAAKQTGRHLDFIAQEISREANTIGAKANNIRISREIIKIKSLVENIREQTQNVE